MSHIFVVLLGLLVLNAVGGEEESPVAISQSADIDERTAIHEDLKPDENSRTINIKIINSEPLEQAISKSFIENDSILKGSAETESLLADIEERAGLPEGFVDHVSESKEAPKIDNQERSGEHDDESRNDFEVAMSRVAKSSDDNIEPSLPEEVSRTEGANEMSDALESSESEGKAMTQDAMVETRGRAGDSPESLEVVKAVSAEDVRTFKSLKPLDNSVLRKRLSDIIMPNYFKALSRSAFHYPSSTHNFNRSPYFGRLTNPIPQSRGFENNGIQNTRRTGSYSTESDQDLKLLEEYTDPDSNAYPYVPGTSIRPIQRLTQNNGLQQKILDATSQQYLSQLNPYSNEFSPAHYAANYPYGINLARFN